MLRSLIQQTTRHFNQHIRQYAYSHRYRANLGIRRQARGATNETDEANLNDIEDLSKFESEFFNTSDTYDEYQRETKEEREKVKQYIVRNKYFNEKRMTFLTWAEMEQIRILKANNSDEWNEDHLVESFPADLVTIKKVLKAKWHPKDAKRISKHDEQVRANWKAFIKGEIKGLDPKFSEHLMKFSKRHLNQKIDYDIVLKKELPKPQKSEFLDIITSCEKYKEEPKQISSDHSVESTLKLPEHKTDETFLVGKVVSDKLYSFKPSRDITDDTTESAIHFNNPSGTGIKKTKKKVDESKQVSTVAINKYETSEVQLSENDMKQLSIPRIQQHIQIPPKLFKEGATYKVDDCYYDDDGEFLYRVPGMTGR